MELCYGKFRGLFHRRYRRRNREKLLPRLDDVDFPQGRTSWIKVFKLSGVPGQNTAGGGSNFLFESNTYGHPSPETIKRLEQNGIKTMYTMKSGAVTVSTDGGHMWMETFCDGKTA